MAREYKYYHGTSTLFIEYILKNGLGGINPNLKFKNLELLKYIYGCCENTLFNEEKYTDLYREITLAMIRQTDLIVQRENNKNETFHFRHKLIYVSLSEFKAVTYSVLNKIGSEILQRCYDLYQLLISNNVSIKIPTDLNHFEIDKIEIDKIKPILIEIKQINKNNLIQENGLDGEEFIEILDGYYQNMTEKDKFINFQYMNFGLKRPINVDLLKVYEIQYNGNIKDENFQYRLVKY